MNKNFSLFKSKPSYTLKKDDGRIIYTKFMNLNLSIIINGNLTGVSILEGEHPNAESLVYSYGYKVVGSTDDDIVRNILLSDKFKKFIEIVGDYMYNGKYAKKFYLDLAKYQRSLYKDEKTKYDPDSLEPIKYIINEDQKWIKVDFGFHEEGINQPVIYTLIYYIKSGKVNLLEDN